MQAHEDGSESTWSLVILVALGTIALVYGSSFAPSILQSTGLPHLGL